jgi:hemolysin III
MCPVTAEAANQITHAVGLLLSLCGAAVMLTAAGSTGDPFRIVGCVIYSLSLVGVYAASTLSHSFEHERKRNLFRMLDQVCILLLVVGSYTPFGLVHARHDGWWLLLAAMWVAALVGIVARVRRGSDGIPIPIFVMMGWAPVLTLGVAWEVSQLTGLMLILGGGAAYTGGTWFLCNDHRGTYYHAAWHVCTITGSALHYLFLLQYVAQPALT